MKQGTLCALVLLTLVLPASADILVTKTGEQIETDGPWEVKGRQVVFTSASGVLSAIRLSEIDLEASELATNPPPPPPPPPPAPPKPKPKPVMVLTNDNVGGSAAEEIGRLVEAFGGALLEMHRAAAHGLADETGVGTDEVHEAVDRQIDAQSDEIQRAYEEMLLSLASMVESHPELKELDPNDRDSLKLHENSIRAAAQEMRVAAHQAQTELGREMINAAAAQLDALVESL